MTKHVIETVTFKLEQGVSKEDFLQTVPCSTDFATAQPGFIARRLSCAEDGTWIEHIEWECMADAKRAAAIIGQTESVKPFLKCIDGPSAKLIHSELETSLG